MTSRKGSKSSWRRVGVAVKSNMSARRGDSSWMRARPGVRLTRPRLVALDDFVSAGVRLGRREDSGSTSLWSCSMSSMATSCTSLGTVRTKTWRVRFARGTSTIHSGSCLSDIAVRALRSKRLSVCASRDRALRQLLHLRRGIVNAAFQPLKAESDLTARLNQQASVGPCAFDDFKLAHVFERLDAETGIRSGNLTSHSLQKVCDFMKCIYRRSCFEEGDHGRSRGRWRRRQGRVGRSAATPNG